MQFGIGPAHLRDQGRSQTVHQRLSGTQQVRMTHGPAHDPAQHIASAFVGRGNPVRNQETPRAQMVSNDAVRGLAVANGLDAGLGLAGADQGLEQIGVVIVVHALHHGGQAL